MPGSYIAYCDESGQRDYGPKTDSFFVVMGVVVSALDAPHLEDELRGLKRALWGSPDVEVKSNWIRQPKERKKYYTDPHGINPPEINALVTALYAWMKKAPIRLVAGVVNKPAMVAQYSAPHYAGAVAYTMFLQRLQKYVSKRQATGTVIFDDPSGKSPGGFEWRQLLQQQHAKLLKFGCPYTKTAFPAIGPITFTDSSSSPFVQVADICAYNTFRQFRMHGTEWDKSGVDSLPLYDHFERICTVFDMGPDNQFANFGVTVWPVAKRIAWTYTP